MRTTLSLLFVCCAVSFFVTGQPTHKKIVVNADMELIPISANAYMHVSRSVIPSFGVVSSNGLIYASKGKAFLFDTPDSNEQTRQLVRWIEDSLHLVVAGFIPNHFHADCMGGLEYLQSKHIPSFANQQTIDIAQKKGLPLPDFGFRDSLKLYLNGKVIACYYLGAGHTKDNIVVWIPSEKILFAGCMVKEMKATTKGNIADADTNAWPTTIKKVMQKFPNAKIVIPGHGDAGGRELLQHTLNIVSK
jgi:metallo-beta-lactamase class B